MYKKLKHITLYLVVAALLTGCTVSTSGFGDNKNKNLQPPKQEQKIGAIGSNDEPLQSNDPNASTARKTPIVAVAQKVGPTVVGITNKGLVRDMFNRQVLMEQGTGSGVIFDPSGLIVTNHHVIKGAKEIAVSLSDGRSVPGRVLGSDPATDLAVVKIDEANLPTAVFGDSDKNMVGEPVVAIGNPLGLEFKGSVTAGIISALNRSLDVGERTFRLIQTDAAINPGNSGGALANADGMVIGINSAKINANGVEGIGFAIPINVAKKVINSILETGKVARPYLGVAMMDKDLAARYGYDLRLDKGILIVRLDSDGPAYQAGLRTDDIITAINGKPVNSVKELRAILDDTAIGSTLDVQILRNNRQLNLKIKVGELPDQE